MFAQSVHILLDNVRSVHNVASLFRTADCVGVEKIILGGITPSPVDRFKKARADFAKVALGAEKSVDWEQVGNIPAVIKKYKKNGFEIVALEQSKTALKYTDYTITKPTLIVLGAEVEGVSKNILKLCDTHVQIEMVGGKESLNVAIAGSVFIFRMRY